MPKKKNSPRAQIASKRKNAFSSPIVRAKKPMQASAVTSSTEKDIPADAVPTLPVLSASVGEPYFSVHELPDSGDQSSVSHSVSSFGTTSHGASSTSALCPEDQGRSQGGFEGFKQTPLSGSVQKYRGC